MFWAPFIFIPYLVVVAVVVYAIVLGRRLVAANERVADALEAQVRQAGSSA